MFIISQITTCKLLYKNEDQVIWSHHMNLQLFNNVPGVASFHFFFCFFVVCIFQWSKTYSIYSNFNLPFFDGGIFADTSCHFLCIRKLTLMEITFKARVMRCLCHYGSPVSACFVKHRNVGDSATLGSFETLTLLLLYRNWLLHCFIKIFIYVLLTLFSSQDILASDAEARAQRVQKDFLRIHHESDIYLAVNAFVLSSVLYVGILTYRD